MYGLIQNNFKSGDLNIQANIQVVPGRSNRNGLNDMNIMEVMISPEREYNTGSRFSITLGFNMNK